MDLKIDLIHLQQLVDVVADVVVRERLIQLLEIRVVDVLEDHCGGSRNGIFHDGLKRDDICSTAEVLQDLDFPFDLLFLDRL